MKDRELDVLKRRWQKPKHKLGKKLVSAMVVILVFSIALVFLQSEFTIWHEKAHAQVCTLFGGTPETSIVYESGIARQGSVLCYNADSDAYWIAQSNIEAIGYHSVIIMEIILVCSGILAMVIVLKF